MPAGPGKYDHIASLARTATNAQAVVVIIIDGDDGSGFSLQAAKRFVEGGESDVLVKVLRIVADQIEKAEIVEEVEDE
jgi:hypothetical protein